MGKDPLAHRSEAWIDFKAFAGLPIDGDATTQPDPARTRESLESFCQRWRVDRLWLFGSILRSDFRDDSDVDILVEFHPDAAWTLVDRFDMEEELTEIVGRRIDLVNRGAVERNHNSIRRRAILESATPLYAAAG